MVRKMIAGLLALSCIYIASPSGARPEPPANSGCCSHHQGVCGCSGGRTTCCDGTYSPSCSCFGG